MSAGVWDSDGGVRVPMTETDGERGEDVLGGFYAGGTRVEDEANVER